MRARQSRLVAAIALLATGPMLVAGPSFAVAPLSTATANSAVPAATAVPATTPVPPPSSPSPSPSVDDAPPTPDPIRERQYWLDEYGIREAWQVTRGEGVTIAIVDSGVDATHPDLAGAVIGGTDVSGSGVSTGTRPVGAQGRDHGTMVASLAAGRGSAPEAGVIGAAPAASILTVSLAFGPGERSGDDQIASAVRWAVDNGADIISLSLTRNTVDWPTSWDDAFGYAEANDVLVIAAAGNRGSGTEQVGAPATMPGILTVGGVDRAGIASEQATAQGITLGVMAPSEQLIGAVPGGGHALWQGTSGATPIVAGIAALVRSAHPDLSAAGTINRILNTAKPVTATVPDPLYGYGLVDASAAVSAVVPDVAANPLGSLAEWIVIHRRAEGEAQTVLLADARPPVARVVGETPAIVEARAAYETVQNASGVVLAAWIALLVGGVAVAVGVSRFVGRTRTE